MILIKQRIKLLVIMNMQILIPLYFYIFLHNKQNNNMQQQQNVANEVQANNQLLFTIDQLYTPNPKLYCDLELIIKSQCKGVQQNFVELLQNLDRQTKYILNFVAFRKLVRVLKKYALASKSANVQIHLSTFLLHQVSKYFPYNIKQNNMKQFNKYIDLLKGLQLPKIESLNDQRQVILYLQCGTYDQQFFAKLLQKVINECIIDKKSQSSKNLKLNPYFSSFLVRYIEKIIPQLERLLVRSESNIEIWEEILINLTSIKGMQKSLDAILKKVKNYFNSYPESCVNIINALGKGLSEQESFKEFIAFVGGIVANEHNSKKKLNYIRMTDGAIKALEKFASEQKNKESASIIANEVLNIFSLAYGRFVEDDQFLVVMELLDSLLPLVKNPTDEIAKNLKTIMKSVNKNVLVYLTVTLAVYNQEQIETFPSVKEIYAHFKTQVPTIHKKALASWQWYVPLIAFMSKVDTSYFDNLAYDLPIYKSSCLSMLSLEKKVLLEMFTRQYSYMLSQEQEIPEHFFTCLAVLLQEIKRKSEWQLVICQTLKQEDKLRLLTEGVYPLLWYPCKDLKKNKNGNNFTSLVWFIIQSFDKNEKLNGYQVKHVERILALCSAVHVQWQRRISFSANPTQAERESFDQKSDLWWESSLLDFENIEQEILVLNQHKKLIKTCAVELLKVRRSGKFNENLTQCLKPINYEKNLEYIITFEQEIKKSLNTVLHQLNETKQMLLERSFVNDIKAQPKKIYYNPLLIDTRMMSEQEVKTEKYRKHFQKMVYYFTSFIEICVQNVKNEEFLYQLWTQHFSEIIRITQYPQTRIPIYRLVRLTIERTMLNIKLYKKRNPINYPTKDQLIFTKYSQFFAQFFSIRHSRITPSISLMEKCSSFLKTFLAIDFNSPFADLIFNKKHHFVSLFINDMCEQILQNMEFDLTIKKLAIQFYYKSMNRLLFFDNDDLLFSYILKNINILSSSQQIKSVLLRIMEKVDILRYNELFEDILSFVGDTKVLILSVVNEIVTKNQVKYQPGFQQYIKLRILALETYRPDICQLANQIIKQQSSQHKDILKFNMKNFMKKNSKETVEKLCIFIKEEMKPEQVEPIFKMFTKTFNELFDQRLDQQCLETYPYFLNLNLQVITPALFGDIFELLVMKFTANESYVTLSKLSMQVGIEIIKYYAAKNIKNGEEILKVLEGFINRSSGVSNIVFLGVLAPFLQGNKNLIMIEKRITQLFKGDKQAEQKSIAKCMPDLMSFFKEPKNLVQKIFVDIKTLPESTQLGQAYLAVGLLKGIGHRETVEYLERLLSTEMITKTRPEKTARIFLFTAFVEIFGRFVEIHANRIIEIVIGYMADSVEEVRNIAKRVVQTLILKLSSYSVQKLLPFLLNGLENESNWRVKISYIWILGIMANCSARQLQTSLPIIVPTLSTCLSNAHPNIRNTASQALNLIGQTIKNPEISNSIDILIEALQNPFEKSNKALEILLKTRFSHFIDAPSLSIIVPITDYCLRGRNSDLKAGACQVIGSIVQLIINPYDLIPYLRIIGTGLKVALCDPLPEIRSIAAMAVGRISAKIGKKNAQQCFQFVLDIIECPTSNTTQRQGAAQAYSEIICSHDYDYFEESLNKIFEKLNEVKHSQKQGYILVFLYVPNIKREEFEGFIKEVNENMYAFVADEDQNIRNSAMLVEKVLINHYCLSHTDLLLDPLCEGVFSTNWRKRNGALILIGELLNILKSHMYNTRTQDKAYAYYKGLMAVYILKDDDLQMPRLTANQVWNTYIENTPKTIRTGLKQLVIMWTKYTHEAGGVVFKNIGEFSSKYGENYFSQILTFMEQFMPELNMQKGIFEVLTEFIKRLQQQFMMKDFYKGKIRDFFTKNIFIVHGDVRSSLAKAMAIWVEKMRDEKFFEELIYPQVQKMSTLSEMNPEYGQCLHLVRDLLHTSSQKITDRLVNQVMEQPLSEFKIQVITNNADKLANQLYTQFKQPATEIFVEEIYLLINDKEKVNRLDLIVYCLEQVSLKLNAKFKGQFVKMMTQHLRKLVQQGNLTDDKNSSLPVIKKLLGIVFFFLSSSELAQLQELEILLGEITPLLFVKSLQINESVHKIFEILISNPKEEKTKLYIKQMIVSIENNALQRGVSIIWEERQTAVNYINILVKCIAYGNSETMEQALDMMQFLMKYTKREIIDKEILKIIGPIVRVVNYPLIMKQKILLMEFVSTVYQKRFNIEAYSSQILSICFRLLQQFKQRDQMMQCISETFRHLLLNSVNKNELMLAIIAKIKVYGNVLVEAVYHLVKSLINEKVDLPKVTYEKAYEEFNHICVHNEMKLPLRGVYYASKTAARLGVMLGVHIQKLQSQLKSLTCAYEIVLNYLHFSYYLKSKVPKLECIEIFIKESSREKVFYLLKSLKLCRKVNTQTKNIYNEKYIKDLVPEGLSGFEDIIDILEEFEDDQQ